MDLLAIFTKTDRLPVKTVADDILPDVEFSDYVSRAIEDAQYSKDRKELARQSSDQRDADRRADSGDTDRSLVADSRHPAREAKEKDGQQEKLETEDRPETASGLEGRSKEQAVDKAGAKAESADEPASGEEELTVDEEALSDFVTAIQADITSDSNSDLAVAAQATPALAILSDQNTKPVVHSSAETNLLANPAQVAGQAGPSSTNASNGEGQKGQAPQASEIAQKIHETLAAKSEPGNPGLQAALAEVLGKANGLRVSTANAGAGEQRPLINAAMLATTGMETKNGKDSSTAFSGATGSGQQTNPMTIGAQAIAASQSVSPAKAGIADSTVLSGNSGEIIGKASSTNSLINLNGTVGGSESIHLGHSLETTGPASLSRASASHAASVTHQVAVQISKAVGAGNDRISIQLDPAELGRIDVKLEISGDGRVVARVVADRQDTLDMLQRDYRGLERALQQAGLQTDSDSLNFNLRQGGQGEGGNNSGDGSQRGNTDETQVAGPDEIPVHSPSVSDHAAENGRLDIQV